MTEKTFCIHAHFYQPPREDPLTNLIPIEKGASPYKNWNEKISAQCYQPNADLGNFEYISFNIGPTLLDWMAVYKPDLLRRIVQQDQVNVNRFGCGNAIAQAFNHTILPLAQKHDKEIQVAWGIQAFHHYFGRMPEGIWLPETAVDLETLEVLADLGLKFTILAPWQTRQKNPDFESPQLVKLRDGKNITVFFYQRDLSTRISFDPASTINADHFASEFVEPLFNNHSNSKKYRFHMVATDGELYGHHQPFRDKFLARLVRESLRPWNIHITYPARILRENPSLKQAVIIENTSWSCHHGVARWQKACGCTPNAQWKEPFRAAIDQFASLVDQEYIRFFDGLAVLPWKICQDYIQVIYEKINFLDFISQRVNRNLTQDELRKAKLLLDAQFEKQRAFTSCGWYFEDFDRIEPQNNVSYAAQSLWLTQLAVDVDLRSKVMPLFEKVRSWRTGLGADQVFSEKYGKAALYKPK